MAMTIEDLRKLDIIRYEKVWVVNKGMSNEQVIAASDIDEACRLFFKNKKSDIISIEKVFDNVIVAAI